MLLSKSKVIKHKQRGRKNPRFAFAACVTVNTKRHRSPGNDARSWDLVHATPSKSFSSGWYNEKKFCHLLFRSPMSSGDISKLEIAVWNIRHLTKRAKDVNVDGPRSENPNPLWGSLSPQKRAYYFVYRRCI